MTVATIIVLVIGIIAIVISFMMTSDTPLGEEGGEEERTTPGIPDELTEADKKKLRKMIDQFTNEYGNKKVKEAVRNSVNAKIDEQLSQKQGKIDEKLRAIDLTADQKIAEIDQTAATDVQKIDEYYQEILEKLMQAKQEAESAYGKAQDKSFEFKKQLAILDEYKKAVEKMTHDSKDEVSPSLSETEEESADSSVDESYETAENNEAENDEAENAEAENDEAENAEAENDEAENADAFVSEEADEQAEEGHTAELADQSAALADDMDEADSSEEAAEDDEEELEIISASSTVSVNSVSKGMEELEEPDETPFFGSRREKEEAERLAKEAAAEEAEAIRRGDERTTVLSVPVIKLDGEEEEYNNDEEFADLESSTAKLDDPVKKVRDKVISFRRKSEFERLKQDPSIDDDLFDEEYDDDDYDEGYDDTDLRDVSNLDEILDQEGIDITDGDVEGNVLGMYRAGFSIIEISKVMKMGVSDVKYIIDHKN